MAFCRVCCCGARGLLITVAVIGTILAAIGLSAEPLIQALLRSQIKSSVNMEGPSADLYDVWTGKEVVPEFMTYYLYNVTNPDEIQNKGALPRLQLVGPFTYREVNIKFNITWNEDDTRVQYFYNRSFILLDKFCSEPSVDTLEPPDCTLPDDIMVTVPNTPLIGFVSQILGIFTHPTEKELENVGLFIAEIQKYFGEQEAMYITRNVSQIIWGYDDPLLQDVDFILDLAKIFFPKLADKITDLPDFIGFQQNNSYAINHMYSAMNTGKDDYTMGFSYEEWAGNEGSLSIWKGCDNSSQGAAYRAQANMLNGTEGMQFRPLLEDDTLLPVYSQDLLRSAVLYPTDQVTVKGIDLRRYRITPHTLKNQTDYPPNCAFGNYGPSGVMNLTQAQNAPVFASKPMFLDADPYYRSRIPEGLVPPVPDKHDTFLDIEPWTGATMHAHQRLQINLQIQQYPYIPMLANVAPGGFYQPIFWADEWAYISDSLADKWKDEVGLALTVAKDAQIAGIACGLGLLGIALSVTLLRLWRARRAAERGETTPLLNSSVNADA